MEGLLPLSIHVKHYSTVYSLMNKKTDDFEIVIGMGAGSVSKWMYNLKNTL